MKKIKEEYVKTFFKGEKIRYKKKTIIGEGEPNIDDLVEQDNKISLNNAYKVHKGLLTNEEVKSIRKELGLTQRQFCEVLGLGITQITRLEKGDIQSKAIDNLIRLYYDKYRRK